jgi:Protein of unknown function (DUF2637)
VPLVPVVPVTAIKDAKDAAFRRVGILPRLLRQKPRFWSRHRAAPVLSATTEKWIRRSCWGAVVAVAGFAAVQSYSHIYWLGATHGQDRVDSALLPLSVDGLILATSLVLLHGARTRLGAGFLAYAGLWLGIGATIAANAAYGLPFGPLGIAASTWPAVAFVISVHVAVGMVKRIQGATPDQVRDTHLVGTVSSDAVEAAKARLRLAYAHGFKISDNALAAQFRLGRGEAAKVRSDVTAELAAALAATNGHGGGDA